MLAQLTTGIAATRLRYWLLAVALLQTMDMGITALVLTAYGHFAYETVPITLGAWHLSGFVGLIVLKIFVLLGIAALLGRYERRMTPLYITLYRLVAVAVSAVIVLNGLLVLLRILWYLHSYASSSMLAVTLSAMVPAAAF